MESQELGQRRHGSSGQMIGTKLGCKRAYNTKWYVSCLLLLSCSYPLISSRSFSSCPMPAWPRQRGQYVHIPIVLRSLVTSLSLIKMSNLPVSFDAAFIALLEVGTSDEEFGRVVKAYAYTWWDKSREPEEAKLLNPNNLDECLIFHDEQLLKSNVPRKTVPRQEIQVTLPFQLPDIGADWGAEAGAEAGAEFQPIVVKIPGHASEVEKCQHCATNQCIVMGALCSTLFDKIKATQQFVSAMAVSSRAEVSVASRRCAGFYRLHERAQEKELLSESIIVQGTGRGTEVQKTSRRVAEIAAADLKRYKAMPSSGRWTWGETLTKGQRPCPTTYSQARGAHRLRDRPPPGNTQWAIFCH
jgi:hypothetical protein